MTNTYDMSAMELLEVHSKAQQKTIELLRVELASAKECWAEALENVATRNREIEQLRGKLNFANREPPHCPSCNCGSDEPTDAPSSEKETPETQRSRIVQAAVAFVDAIDTDMKAAVVSKQAFEQWLELSDAVICARNGGSEKSRGCHE